MATVQDLNRIGIIVPVFNRFSYLEGLVQMLEGQSFQNFELLVVDHGTKDCPQLQSERFPISILKESSALWFTGAVNAGLRKLAHPPHRFTHFMLLNDDVVIDDSNWLLALLKHANPMTLISCMGGDLSGRVQYASVRFNPWRFSYWYEEAGCLLEDVEKKVRHCDALPTRGILFHKDIYERIGPLNEELLPHYGSDYEWTERARKLGFNLLMTSETYLRTEVNDHSKASSGRKIYQNNVLSSFKADLFNRHLAQNYYDLRNYSRLVFRVPYSEVYLAFHLAKKILAFGFTNISARFKSAR